MKPTIASLSCLVEVLQGQLAAQDKRIIKLEAERKARVIAYLKTNDISSDSRMPKGYENLSPEAKAIADASLQRRLELRNKQQSTAH